MAGPFERLLEHDKLAASPGWLRLVGDDGPMPQRRPISVLYVEDDDDDVFLLTRQIAKLPGFSVDLFTVPTLGLAREALADRRFDIVLCDFWLGCETTIALIDDLSAAPWPSPVVLVSSLENDDIELIGRRAGAAGFVSKQDLSAVALDRIFTTLLPARPSAEAAAVEGGLGDWFRSVLRGIDRAKALSGAGVAPVGDTAAALADVIAHSTEIRGEILTKLAGIVGQGRGQPAALVRFDALAYVIDAVADLRRRAPADVTIAFLEPAMPIEIDGNPTLFADLVQGFFAEAAERIDLGFHVAIAPKVADGAFSVEIRADGDGRRPPVDPAPRAAAAAETRRLLVETLARTCGGGADLTSGSDHGRVGRLSVPLRQG